MHNTVILDLQINSLPLFCTGSVNFSHFPYIHLAWGKDWTNSALCRLHSTVHLCGGVLFSYYSVVSEKRFNMMLLFRLIYTDDFLRWMNINNLSSILYIDWLLERIIFVEESKVFGNRKLLKKRCTVFKVWTSGFIFIFDAKGWKFRFLFLDELFTYMKWPWKPVMR